jgi:hypothetical protein
MQPGLADLLERYLQQAASSPVLGGTPGEVVPFDAVPARPVDARLAWDGAVAVVPFLNPGFAVKTWKMPEDWPTLIASQDSTPAVAFCVGNFPQLVQSLQPLVAATDMSSLRPTGVAAPPVTTALDLSGLPRQSFPQVLESLSLLRLAGRFDEAAHLTQTYRKDVPTAWQAAWANEEAALAWHRGRADQARQLWQAQPDSPPVLFNRGMAALFCNEAAEARSTLAEAVAALPDADSWHHLGRLYLALAQMRR